jgi:hypothetical protein
MKFYVIPPNKHLDMMDNGDGYFCLAHHYLQNNEYRQHFLSIRKSKPEAFIILDNGAAEHSLVTEEALLGIVRELRPTEVIAPDALFNTNQTMLNFYSFVDKMDKQKLFGRTSIFACPQGSTKEEWLSCYQQMIAISHVSCIGLSKIAVPKCWNNAVGDTMIGTSRNECVTDLVNLGLLKKPLHLLGMGEHNEFDFYLQHKIPHIRSSDSCYTVLASLHEIAFEEGDTTRIPTENAYFDVELNSDQKALAKRNIQYLKNTYRFV